MMQFEEFLALLQESGVEVSKVGHEEHHSWIDFNGRLIVITHGLYNLSMFLEGQILYWPTEIDLYSDMFSMERRSSVLPYDQDTLKKIKRMLA